MIRSPLTFIQIIFATVEADLSGKRGKVASKVSSGTTIPGIRLLRLRTASAAGALTIATPSILLFRISLRTCQASRVLELPMASLRFPDKMHYLYGSLAENIKGMHPAKKSLFLF